MQRCPLHRTTSEQHGSAARLRAQHHRVLPRSPSTHIQLHPVHPWRQHRSAQRLRYHTPQHVGDHNRHPACCFGNLKLQHHALVHWLRQQAQPYPCCPRPLLNANPLSVQQEGFLAPCGGVVAATHNIAPIGGDGVRFPKLRAVGQQVGVGEVQVLHATRCRPAKGTPLPCGVASGADYHGAIGGNASSLAPTAARQRAEVLHPTRRRPAKGTPLPCGVVSCADHHGAIGGNAISRALIAPQRAEVLHPTRRRPAKGTLLPCGVVSPADHHGAIGGNA
jgi:hypothetical protein